MLKLEEVLEKLTEAFNWDSDKEITLMALQDYFSDLSQLQNNQLNRVEIIDKKNTKYGGFNVIIEGDNCLIQSRNKTKSSAYSKSYLGNGNKLNAVYYSCLMFIEWYNENVLK